MSSSSDNLPIADEPTRDDAGFDHDVDSLGFSSSSDQDSDWTSNDVPDRIGGYSIRELIGSGGMGNVYLAEHTRMQRIVAIKMLPIDRMKDESAVQRFYDEVRAASRLMHPNIVTAFDAGESDDGIHYLAMEYVDGVTLTRLVAMRGPLPVGEAAAIIQQAALGLLHAHRAGIIHRDVKPGNLMRASDGTIKVLDLGLARISEADLSTSRSSSKIDHEDPLKSSKGRLVGTLPFMSPEQLEDPDQADARSDIYSLGATMYFLLTASPPFVGEYLDQVYGHRHGEIPDLMQVRSDVDLHFANIFSRMMAKKPDQRYVSLDEVIDDLSAYTSQVDAPVWLAEFAQRRGSVDSPSAGSSSTFAGGSTSTAASKVFAIDFGMFYSATASASPIGGVESLESGGPKRPLFRMAIASDEDRLLYGQDAIDRRSQFPQSLLHCLPMYIGKPVVDRKVAGRACPPEVLMAMLIRQIHKNAWSGRSQPLATAITVPASYDQLHRRSILQAAKMAGLESVRLVDRSLAAVQSLWIESESAIAGESLRESSLCDIETDHDQTVLFVGVSGQASEIALIRRNGARLNQLASGGHWHQGTLPWLHRLVDLAAARFSVKHHFDPRESLRTAARLQIACEKAMNTMLLAQSALIKIETRDGLKTVSIDRDDWVDACDDLVVAMVSAVRRTCADASVQLSDVDVCVTMGAIMRIGRVRDAVTEGLSADVLRRVTDRSDVARGAAACLAAELPGRGDVAMPPRSVSGQSIGIVIEDAKGRRRILPIIPKGTSLPARTNRRLTIGKGRSSMTLSLVESSGVVGDDWHSLGRYEFGGSNAKGGDNDRPIAAQTIGFEVNVNGLLTVRTRLPGTASSTKLPPLPTPVITDESMKEWTKWIDGLR
ncbi:Serine/threonine-protein kinase PrkC [Rubripirellula tenax]|uniref:Serine/threonine-protein kinase PrkC n=1 Tax=Rubripirellula tenax TaxID=2528015 RepID=A0A5C6FJ06_9BACT|nr:Hsp70 family protein [Rubripirellula tenax]TWU60039.1 Serine/threonine-protein kinase PrkC [Rubripirellula tenax]